MAKVTLGDGIVTATILGSVVYISNRINKVQKEIEHFENAKCVRTKKQHDDLWKRMWKKKEEES